MADGYDRFENEGGGGGSFVMGLLTGTVLGAGLGMLFAPKAGSELRNQLSEQAGTLANTASEGIPPGERNRRRLGRTRAARCTTRRATRSPRAPKKRSATCAMPPANAGVADGCRAAVEQRQAAGHGSGSARRLAVGRSGSPGAFGVRNVGRQPSAPVGPEAERRDVPPRRGPSRTSWS